MSNNILLDFLSDHPELLAKGVDAEAFAAAYAEQSIVAGIRDEILSVLPDVTTVPEEELSAFVDALQIVSSFLSAHGKVIPGKSDGNVHTGFDRVILSGVETPGGRIHLSVAGRKVTSKNF